MEWILQWEWIPCLPPHFINFENLSAWRGMVTRPELPSLSGRRCNFYSARTLHQWTPDEFTACSRPEFIRCGVPDGLVATRPTFCGGGVPDEFFFRGQSLFSPIFFHPTNKNESLVYPNILSSPIFFTPRPKWKFKIHPRIEFQTNDNDEASRPSIKVRLWICSTGQGSSFIFQDRALKSAYGFAQRDKDIFSFFKTEH